MKPNSRTPRGDPVSGFARGNPTDKGILPSHGVAQTTWNCAVPSKELHEGADQGGGHADHGCAGDAQQSALH